MTSEMSPPQRAWAPDPRPRGTGRAVLGLTALVLSALAGGALRPSGQVTAQGASAPAAAVTSTIAATTTTRPRTSTTLPGTSATLAAAPVPLGVAAVSKPAKRLSQMGELLFPMQVVPKCAILDNFRDARSGGRRHEGLDILATEGQEVYAVEDGVLHKQYVDGGPNSSLSGNAWQLNASDGTYYFFAHLSRFADGLAVGDTVQRGDVIGYVGDTGNPGPGNYHLHFEVHPSGGTAVDPLSLLEIPAGCSVT